MGPPCCSGAAWHVGRASLQRRSQVTPPSSGWRTWRVHHATKRVPRQLSAAASGSGEGESFNIDELAKRLSQEAEKLRQSGASMDYGAEEEEEEQEEVQAVARRESAPPANLLQPLGYQVRSYAASGMLCFAYLGSCLSKLPICHDSPTPLLRRWR